MPAIFYESNHLTVSTNPSTTSWSVLTNSSREPGSPVSVYYSPSEKAAISSIEYSLDQHKGTPVGRGDRGTHDAQTDELKSELKAVESVARARSTMLSYSRTPVPVRDRSLSLDQTVFVKEKKSVEEEAAQYNQWRRETSETDLYALAKAAEIANEVAPITTITSPIRQSYVTMGAYARVYKMAEVEADEDEDEVAYYGVDSASNGYKARHVFQDFKHVMGHIARSR
mmetsp:Transcript_20234/g.42653  ORF Transcript_20234/g.42653 Transcript_20234/m.42653 type:complete len:227 (-) Transcript_20234:368-1048(-)|eukprot:CAMPEP_0182532910 /NCGR_PEP_ID=MMETSP1323-20130603/12581_1 /TAXON_ID=236787 /ORGANISM="Florenciella parvula, Strain RCC1693" /LENGTH=226 /DNA_ID=CAMNT_0024742719 /DNA_START=80 /DNA_END=760 /DNA_ORIENTATION=+